ncbi:hypothetical protein [Flavivirga sp. 57AJ16]|uniref:hypothetical protein n=1 Tax=Flavivirga sp. 57AJ16 TaxID=3025307 RepID=UPI002366A359|nr:hypothetical protein [Flavivirga sp. 57AJ16]MDD7886615.1 hypothetical protein [Flavivirga sp. 57AJ16]
MKVYKNKSQELEAKIIALENKQKNEFSVLKNELNMVYGELRPSQLLNRALMDLKKSPNTKNNLFEITVSVLGGYFSKKLLIGKSNNIFKSLLGYAVQYVSTKVISKNIK